MKTIATSRMTHLRSGVCMNNRKLMARRTVSILLTGLALSACGADSPESMLASAKDYLAKNDSRAAVIQLKNALQNKPDLAEARFLLGKALLEDGNATGAEIELRKAADLQYPADQLVPVQARALLALGQTKRVVDELGKVQLTSSEGKADLNTTLGRAWLALGKMDAAQAAFNEALSAMPDYGPAVFGQARIKAANRDFAAATTLIDSVLEKNPAFIDALQFKGDILSVQGKMNESGDAYRKILQTKPDYLPAHASLIARHIESGKLDEAGKQFEAMKKVAPSHPQTSYVQAELLFREKKFKEARDAIQQHLRSLPGSVQGLQLAGAIEYELQSYATAERYLQDALSKAPGLGLARRMLIATYLRSRQPDKALSVLEPILDKIDDNSNLLALAGEVFMQNGDADKAETYFAKAAALDPENQAKRTSVALSQLAQGETDTATRELEKIASIDTGIKADLALIASHLRARKFDQALKAIDTLEKKQPDNPLTDNLRGSALVGKRDFAGARQSFEKALSKNAAYFPAAASLARLDIADKKPEDAKKRFESVLAKDPKNTQAWLALAELLARSGGKPDEVAALIGKAIAANPADVPARLALINLHLGTKDAKKAVSAAQDALVALPDNLAILDAEGRAQQAAENYNQALATYGKLATLAPTSQQPHLRMAEVHMAAKNKEAALQSLRKALSVKPDSIEAQRGIMMFDLEAGRVNDAIARARNIQKQHPKNVAGYLLEGDAYALGKSWKEAANAYRNGTRQTAAPELAVKLYAVLMAQNLPAEADKFAESWMRDQPADGRFRLYVAESATARKDYVSAIKHYKYLLDKQPNNPALMNNLAWAMGQAKDPKAIELAEQAYKLAPAQPTIIDTLGALLVAKGDVDRGLELLQKANSLAPKNPTVKLNLAKALIKAGKAPDARKELEEIISLGEKLPAANEARALLQGLK